MSKNIVLTGNASGGHLFSLATVAQKIKETYSSEEEIKFMFIGPSNTLVKDAITQQYGFVTKKIVTGHSGKSFPGKSVINFIKTIIGTVQSLWHVFIFMPDAVFAKGGFSAIPVVLAAKFYRIPVLLHESNATPTDMSKFLGSFADRIAIAFQRARIYYPKSRVTIIRNPVRRRAIGGSKEKGRGALGIRKEFKPVILFMSGSGGSAIMNNRILFMLESLISKYQVIHQTGKKYHSAVVKEAQKKGFKVGASDYYPVPFIEENIGNFYALADVIVTRSGSMTISEIAANEKPSILVPSLRSEKKFQRINAYEVAKVGAAVVLGENNFKTNLLLYNINQMINNSRLRQRMIENIKKFYQVDATDQLMKEVIELSK